MSHEATPTDPRPAANAVVTPVGKLAKWADARLPLPSMLRALGEEQGGRTGEAIKSLADQIELGRPLKEALAETSSRFPRSLRRQLETVAEATGELPAVLPALASLFASERRLRSRLISTLSYPLIVLMALVSLVLVLSWSVAPEFTSLYSDFDLEVPAATTFFFNLCRVAPVAIFAGGAILLAMIVAGTTPGLSHYVHWFVGSLPLVGPLWTYESHGSLARMLAAYTAARLPTADALRCAAAGLVDRNLAAAAVRAARLCEGGAPLADAMAESRHFQRELVDGVREGEQSSSLPESLEAVASAYGASAQRQLDFLARSLPPLMIVLVGGFLMMFVPAIFLPMLKLIEGLT